MAYDVNLGGIDFPTFEQDFTETVGADYALVGSAVLPGPPRPASLYSFTLNIYGDSEEPDRTAEGFTKRAAIKALLQNASSRYSGLAFTVAFDSSLNGYLVIGTGDLAYAVGGATYGDFTLRVQGAVWISAPLTINAAIVRGVEASAPPLDAPTVRSVPRDVETRHYLPVGAYDVTAKYGDLVPETHEYETIEGRGVYVVGRIPGEAVFYEQGWDDVLRGQVRIWDRMGTVVVKNDRAGDARPDRHYGWRRLYGPLAIVSPGDAPVLDNGRCRVSWDGDGSIAVEMLRKGVYVPGSAVQTGYETVGRAHVMEWNPERGVVRFALHDGGRRGEAWVTLARGWEGPTVDIRHLNDPKPSDVKGRLAVESGEAGGWEQFRIGGDADSRAHVVHQISRAA